MDNKFPFLVVKMNTNPLPTMVQKKDIDWVYFGEKNEYPEYLLRLYNESAKHRALIDGKSSYVFGKGVGSEKFLDLISKARANDFIETSEYGEGINDILRKIIKDEELFGGFYVEIIWNKSGNKIVSRKHIDFSYIRSNSDNTEFYYTKNWTIKGKDGTVRANQKPNEEEDFEIYKPFSSEERKGKQLFFYKSYSPSLQVYPLAGYVGAIKAIETDVEITNYHYNNLKNGFTATVLINFNNGRPEPEEMEAIEEQLKEKLTGTNNAGRFILSFSDGKDKSAEVTVLSMSDADKQFEQLRKDIVEEVFIGHRINNPMLFGIKTEGQLGGRTEIIEANQLFQSIYVDNKQKVFENFVNLMASFSGVSGYFTITPSDPIGLDWFGNDNLYNLLTLEEKREKAGLPKLKQGLTNTTVTQTRFSKVSLAQKLRERGESGSNYEVIAERPLRYEGFQRQQEKEVEFLQEGFAVIETKIKTLERSILDLLKKEPDTSVETLAEVLKVTPKKIQNAIDSLKDQKLLKGNNAPTNKGSKELENKPAKTTEIFIRYKYKVRGDVPNKAPIIASSRDFCRELLQDGKNSDGRDGNDLFWSLVDINELSAHEGYDVFEYTGGFYHNPNTGETTPQCRHEWVETIVQKVS